MTIPEYDNCVASYADALFRFAFKSLQDSDEAKDIVQESFLRLWEKRNDVLGGKEKSYLFTVGHHLIVDKVRLRVRYTTDEAMLRTTYGGHTKEYDNLPEILEQSLGELPQVQRSVIMLRDYEGYSYQEIATITRLSKTQVKVYIFRARKALKKSIGSINNIL